MNTRISEPTRHPAAVIWLDPRHALIARLRDGRPEVTEVDRFVEPEAEYLLRVVHEAAACDRLVVMGPDASRLAFEREYVGLYRRPDRLIDLGEELAPGRADLVDRLRFIEPVSSVA